jgi:hypothetical protein
MMEPKSDSKVKPAKGGEKILLYCGIAVASLFLVSNLFAEEFVLMFFLVPLFMIVAAVARLKGWVKLGGAPGGGGGAGG